MDAIPTTFARETVAVVAADGSGIDLLHADVERDTETGHELHVEPAGQDWIDRYDSQADDDGLLLNCGWRVTGAWRETAHYGGDRETDVEQIA